MEDIQVIIHDSSDDNESGRLVQPPQNSPLPTSPFRQSRTIANRMMEHKISQEKKKTRINGLVVVLLERPTSDYLGFLVV